MWTFLGAPPRTSVSICARAASCSWKAVCVSTNGTTNKPAKSGANSGSSAKQCSSSGPRAAARAARQRLPAPAQSNRRYRSLPPVRTPKARRLLRTTCRSEPWTAGRPSARVPDSGRTRRATLNFVMPKTEVILTHNIVGLGGESDHVKVAAGYARNFLFPQGLAIPLTQANKRRLEVLRQRRAEREAHEFNTMSELAKSLSRMTLVLTAKTGEDGKMFGSITPGAIADELKHQFEIAIDKKKIHLEHPLRAIGEHEIELRLNPEVTTTLKIRIDSATPLSKPVEAHVPEAKAKETPARGREAATEKTREITPDKAEAKKERPPRKPKIEKSVK